MKLDKLKFWKHKTEKEIADEINEKAAKAQNTVWDEIITKHPKLMTLGSPDEQVKAYFQLKFNRSLNIHNWVIIVLTTINVILTAINVYVRIQPQ